MRFVKIGNVQLAVRLEKKDRHKLLYDGGDGFELISELA